MTLKLIDLVPLSVPVLVKVTGYVPGIYVPAA